MDLHKTGLTEVERRSKEVSEMVEKYGGFNNIPESEMDYMIKLITGISEKQYEQIALVITKSAEKIKHLEEELEKETEVFFEVIKRIGIKYAILETENEKLQKDLEKYINQNTSI